MIEDEDAAAIIPQGFATNLGNGALPALEATDGAGASRESRRWLAMVESVVIPIGALVVSLALFGIFCALAGANPFSVYHSIYRAAFGNWYSFQNTLIRAAPIMLCALCTALPMQLGLVMIGNEGAFVMGGLGAVLVGTTWTSASHMEALIAMAVAGMILGGLWIMSIGSMRLHRGVNEVIAGLLMNYIAIAILNHLVNGPMHDPSSLNKPSSFPIPDANSLGSIPGTRVQFGLVYGIVACIASWFLIKHTTFGLKARIVGGNIRAARLAGLPVGSITLIICFLGGAMAGLGGMAEVAAVQGCASASLAAGYGYAGILVAFVSRQNGLGILFVSILLGGMLASGGMLQRENHLSDAIVIVFQGIVFLTILFSESLYGRFKIFQEKTA
ncbi:MAG TPA: ABC transporter permease [Chthoniobacteraceae bacterium]|jgi:simple sugar transport system permease protein|nr:ABC transporter permease [Chthoniobacteraceae bacterium]